MNKRSSCIKRVNRREFCQAAMMAGLVFRPGIKGIPLLYEKKEEANRGSMIHQEEDMKKKITSVIAKVKSQRGNCALGHQVGDFVTFTETAIKGKICIHALYSMLPAVFAMMYEAHFPWLKDPDTKTHACPDANNPVVFEISRIRES